MGSNFYISIVLEHATSPSPYIYIYLYTLYNAVYYPSPIPAMYA